MAGEPVIRFGKSWPIFPLGAVVLFPHGVLPLHIFEERYRQMVDDVLDTSGQIAMAVQAKSDFDDDDQWDAPPVRPVVCIGQIVRHQRLPDGRFYIWLQGLVRAKIARELPHEPGKLYREAILEPLWKSPATDEASLNPTRERLSTMLTSTPLNKLRDAKEVMKHIQNRDVPTSAILELMTLSFINDDDIRYKLLATGDPRGRARVIESELESIARLLRQAESQMQNQPPKGCSWN
ncbi:MAG: LON peptidase substrate-binding domain-containing protein [Phycisphaerales bacterium]